MKIVNKISHLTLCFSLLLALIHGKSLEKNNPLKPEVQPDPYVTGEVLIHSTNNSSSFTHEQSKNQSELIGRTNETFPKLDSDGQTTQAETFLSTSERPVPNSDVDVNKGKPELDSIILSSISTTTKTNPSSTPLKTTSFPSTHEVNKPSLILTTRSEQVISSSLPPITDDGKNSGSSDKDLNKLDKRKITKQGDKSIHKNRQSSMTEFLSSSTPGYFTSYVDLYSSASTLSTEEMSSTLQVKNAVDKKGNIITKANKPMMNISSLKPGLNLSSDVSLTTVLRKGYNNSSEHVNEAVAVKNETSISQGIFYFRLTIEVCTIGLELLFVSYTGLPL